MRHIVYAVFENRSAANEVVASLRESNAKEIRQVRFHRTDNLDLEDTLHLQKLDLDETDAGPALRRGLLLGIATGLVVALILALTLELPVGETLIYGLLVGAIGGGLASFLIGAGLPDRKLRRVHDEAGGEPVLVTFETADAEATERVSDVLQSRGARIAEKSAV